MNIDVFSIKPRPASLLLAVCVILFAAAAPAQISTNTTTNSTVRFRIAHGATLFGDVDVELFDSLRPITVSNFLTYAQSGRYADTILHRLAPGFIIEGGGYSVPTPFADVPLQAVSVVRADPPIPNEFNVGGVQGNALGTLAMSKTPGEPNSATSRWFFNLGDNTRGSGSTNLNTANGGHTVFGRVIAGLNVLQRFNNRQLNNGIIDTTSPLYRNSCPGILLNPGGLAYPFAALPVSYFGGFGCPNYTDVYTIDIIFLNAPDVVRPTVTIISPKLNASLADADVTVRGTVTDNAGVTSVRIRLGTNNPVDAEITSTNWIGVLTNVPPGTNSIVAEAVDTSGLRGQAVITFFRSVRVPLTLGVIGHGVVKGATDQQPLEIGRGYTLTARPARGNLFAGWIGDTSDINGDNPTLKFLMTSNRAITAVFATNLFPAVNGTYSGLFFNPYALEQASSGAFTLTVAKAGAYSARILMNGRRYALKGVFSPDGNETNLVARPGTNSLEITLALDLHGGSDQLTGTLTDNPMALTEIIDADSDAGWSSVLLADRATFNARANPAPQAGRYTVLIPPDTNSAAGPPADGYGAVNVRPNGSLSFAGSLPDGTRAAQGTRLSKSGTWPFYATIGRGAEAGALISWLTFTNDTAIATDVGGLLNWFKPARDRGRYYAAGFTNETMVAGSRFLPGTPTNRVLMLTNAIVGFTHGDLASDFGNIICLDANGRALNLETNKLTLGISKSTGLFGGAVKPPGATKSIRFKGAVLQKQNRGAGYFLGADEAGQVTIAEEPSQ